MNWLYRGLLAPLDEGPEEGLLLLLRRRPGVPQPLPECPRRGQGGLAGGKDGADIATDTTG